MSTRTKLERTRFFLDELKYSLKNKLYNKQVGGVRLLQISILLVDTTYDGKHDKDVATSIWESIDEIIPQYQILYSEEIKENINNHNSRI